MVIVFVREIETKKRNQVQYEDEFRAFSVEVFEREEVDLEISG